MRYLGIILSNDMGLKLDIERALNAFLSQFHSMHNKFKFLDRKEIFFLFKNFSTSFCGVNLLYHHCVKETHLRKISVAFHKAVKRVTGLDVWSSNHVACEVVGISVFRHLFFKRMFKFFLSLIASELPLFNRLRYFFWSSAVIKTRVDEIFNERYGIVNFLRNDFKALFARIDYVERNEPRSNYVP